MPLETTYTARTANLSPRSYSAKGKSSRLSDMDDVVKIDGNLVSIQRGGKAESRTASQSWFITDGYSPVAMQEHMMRWSLLHGKPARLIVYPSYSEVHIESAGTLTIGGRSAHGYTVGGLIWGQESL